MPRSPLRPERVEVTPPSSPVHFSRANLSRAPFRSERAASSQVRVTPPPSQINRPTQAELQAARRESHRRAHRTYNRKKKAATPSIARSNDHDHFAENEYKDYLLLEIGKLGDVVCKYCGAHRFKNELESICCNKGDVKLPKLPLLPAQLRK